ncbi:septum formation initiator family protein [Garciella nitratireducens]|uniref:Cell division protein FtsL n=1 Tax=Garciella nitratireducens DSM 15102 TaxID=1121911 RepID=A0A1T4JT29_9FIRM|nr:septum formation initiator family protein [Garciella nitratireducens]RBP45550.1 cell division protein FtsL [Garciella nitratireducens]SJZ33346.1 cell division protein FtsL [Garciella nitratireducens DSM 15102]
MLVAEERQYDSMYQEPIHKSKNKTRKKVKPYNKVKTKRNLRFITYTFIGFLLALVVLFQYVKLNNISQEIIFLEKELKQLNKLNDSLEGEMIANEDLQRIEKIAKEELGMVEPNENQMIPIEIEKSNNIKAATNQIKETPNSSGLLRSLSKILSFID